MLGCSCRSHVDARAVPAGGSFHALGGATRRPARRLGRHRVHPWRKRCTAGLVPNAVSSRRSSKSASATSIDGGGPPRSRAAQRRAATNRSAESMVSMSRTWAPLRFGSRAQVSSRVWWIRHRGLSCRGLADDCRSLAALGKKKRSDHERQRRRAAGTLAGHVSGESRYVRHRPEQGGRVRCRAVQATTHPRGGGTRVWTRPRHHGLPAGRASGERIRLLLRGASKPASGRAAQAGLAERLVTLVHDVREPLPLPDASADAVYSHMLFSMALVQPNSSGWLLRYAACYALMACTLVPSVTSVMPITASVPTTAMACSKTVGSSSTSSTDRS